MFIYIFYIGCAWKMSTNKLCKNLNIRTLKVKYKTVY